MIVIVNQGHVVDTGDKVHRPGDGLDLPNKEAQKLMKRGVVRKGTQPKKEDK